MIFGLFAEVMYNSSSNLHNRGNDSTPTEAMIRRHHSIKTGMVNGNRLCLRFLFGGPEDMAVTVVNFDKQSYIKILVYTMILSVTLVSDDVTTCQWIKSKVLLSWLTQG